MLVLSKTHLYWSEIPDGRHIFRYPLAGGTVETVATSRFSDGDLHTFDAVLTGDWLVFLDTHSIDETAWIVRALNVKDHTEQVVVEESGDPASAPGPDFDADGDWVVWTRLQSNPQTSCVETVLAMRNLKTREQRELDRACPPNHYTWSLPHLIGNKVVVEQDSRRGNRAANDIYLIDVVTGQRTALTTDGRSSMPSRSDRSWIAWKAAPRFGAARRAILQNLRTGERRTLSATDEDPYDPRFAGGWFYWPPAETSDPLYFYDLRLNRKLQVAVPGKNEGIGSPAGYRNMAAWVRILDENAKVSDSILEWRTLP